MLQCRACKERQRKCVWQANDLQTCVYCSLSNRECVPFYEQVDNSVKPTLPTHSTFQYWNQQVINVEKAMQHLRHGIRDCYAVEKPNGQEEHQWQLTIENGQLRLLSDIKTSEELLLYGQAFSRYLAPLQGFIYRQLSSIELDCEASAFDIISNAFRFIIHAFLQNPPQRLHKSYGIQGVNPIIHQLVHVYVDHQNPILPLLHGPTYLEYYRRLKDPLSCPVTLAICATAICSTRRVKGYASIHRRQLADLFFAKCKSILVDMFDDPNRQLDTVITISLLYHYIVFVLLDFAQARRLATVAVLLCNDMVPIYRDKYNDKQLSGLQKALFERHYVQTAITASTLKIKFEAETDDRSFYKNDLEVLPGEDQETRDYIALYSHVLRLSFMPFVTNITETLEHMNVNAEAPHLLSMEHILHFDEALREWWRKLPGNIRLCDDPLDDIFITRTDSAPKLLMYGHMHETMLMSYGFFIKPLYTLKTSKRNDGNLISILYERCISVTLQSLQCLLSAILQTLSIRTDVCTLTFIGLTRVIHTFHILFSSVPDIKIPPNIEMLFMACMEEINKTVFPLDHCVPSHQSPLKSYMATRCTKDLMGFFKYPLPGYAFIADIFNTASAYVISRFQGPSLPDPLSFVHFITNTAVTSGN